jgi:hypothetical protein
MRVCQFRHDGKWTFIAAAATGRRIRKTYPFILQTRRHVSNIGEELICFELFKEVENLICA